MWARGTTTASTQGNYRRLRLYKKKQHSKTTSHCRFPRCGICNKLCHTTHVSESQTRFRHQCGHPFFAGPSHSADKLRSRWEPSVADERNCSQRTADWCSQHSTKQSKLLLQQKMRSFRVACPLQHNSIRNPRPICRCDAPYFAEAPCLKTIQPSQVSLPQTHARQTVQEFRLDQAGKEMQLFRAAESRMPPKLAQTNKVGFGQTDSTIQLTRNISTLGDNSAKVRQL